MLNLEGYIFEKLFTTETFLLLKNYGMDFRFFENNEIIESECIWDGL